MQLSFGIEPTLFTAGYQGRTIDAFVRLLSTHGIKQVIDVREHPSSRRPGFAKTPLSRALGEAGIGYVHLREAGNPFRHDDSAPWQSAYAAHLDAHPEIVERVAEAAKTATSVLVCFERDPRDCHRSILAERIASRFGTKIAPL